ncbi:MAG: hypothetical protein JO272_01645 [Pseudonocardiales bacterium]|nr:hypothetical protein [Pseudonocardiales bacterium]
MNPSQSPAAPVEIGKRRQARKEHPLLAGLPSAPSNSAVGFSPLIHMVSAIHPANSCSAVVKLDSHTPR